MSSNAIRGKKRKYSTDNINSGGRIMYLSHLYFFLSYLQVRFYLMEMDCMLSTSGWLVCEVCAYMRRCADYPACSPEKESSDRSIQIDVVWLYLLFLLHFSESSKSDSTSTSPLLLLLLLEATNTVF
ncbi:hypothetical protein Tco_0841534 [Tanacetum coccineum]|uniref:Uncharacterized protein n=1 Tax=Tanacetum coccineum TaxID=301880 RepID=A0ABQ5AZE7_9ASTR